MMGRIPPVHALHISPHIERRRVAPRPGPARSAGALPFCHAMQIRAFAQAMGHRIARVATAY